METEQALLQLHACDGLFPFVRNPVVTTSEAFHEWFHALTGRLFGGRSGTARYYLVAESTPENQLADRVEDTGSADQCLFSGEAAERLRYASPWLLEASPDSRLFRQLMSAPAENGAIWGKQPIVFICGALSRQELLGHLRRFTHVRADGTMNGGRTFFRFWEARILPEYFRRTAHRPQNLPFFQAAGSSLAICYADGDVLTTITPKIGAMAAAPFSLDIQTMSRISAELLSINTCREAGLMFDTDYLDHYDLDRMD